MSYLKRVFRLATLIVMMGWPLPQAALAQAADEVLRTPTEAMSSRRFTQSIGSRDFQKQLYDVGVMWDVNRGAACPDGQHTLQPLGLTEILQPVTFPANAAMPAGGHFIMGYSLTRCGRSITYKVVVGATPQGQYRATPWLPGDSIINYQLFRDALPSISSIAAAADAGCKQVMILDTAAPTVVESNLPAYGGTKGERRRERWWLAVCGKPVALDFDTFPNPNLPGLSYALKPAPDAPAPALR